MIKLLRKVFNIASWLFIAVIFIIAIFTIGSNTNIIGGYKSFMVLSGSMEPSIFIGDIIIVHRENQYLKNDVITFYGEEGRMITHRVVSTSEENDQIKYITKGDANRSEDDASIFHKAVIGKVVFVTQKLGFLVNFTKTIPRLIIMIFIPAFALITDQVLKMLKK